MFIMDNAVYDTVDCLSSHIDRPWKSAPESRRGVRVLLECRHV